MADTTNAQKPRIGRPPKAPEDKQSCRLCVHLSLREISAVRRLAQKRGEATSQMVRRMLLAVI